MHFFFPFFRTSLCNLKEQLQFQHSGVSENDLLNEQVECACSNTEGMVEEKMHVQTGREASCGEENLIRDVE